MDAGRPERARAGAMTRAMQAARSAEGPKVLRIGVLEGTTVVDERVLRARAAVSVGRTEKSTIAVAAEGFPRHFELFAVEGGRYVLRFTDAMQGRVALPTGVHSLDELRDAGRARSTAQGFALELDDDARGKVTLAGVTFLFQFVPPPPAQPRPQLPAVVRARPFGRADGAYGACLAAFLTAAFCAGAYVEYGYDPEVEDAFALTGPIVRDLLPPPVAEPPPARDRDEAMATEPAPDSSHDAPTAPSHPQRSGPAAPSPSSRPSEDSATVAIAAAQRAADAVAASLARFGALTGTLDNGRSAADVFAQGGLMSGSTEALANVGGVATARSNDLGRRDGAGNAIAANSGNLFGTHRLHPGGDAIAQNTNPVERVPTGAVHLEPLREPTGDPGLPIDAIGATIRQSLGGIRQCYNVALRDHPTLAGRIELHFTIGTTGRVVGTPRAAGLEEDPRVGQCIANRVRYLVFPPPTDGSVDADIPFNFDHTGN